MEHARARKKLFLILVVWLQLIQKESVLCLSVRRVDTNIQNHQAFAAYFRLNSSELIRETNYARSPVEKKGLQVDHVSRLDRRARMLLHGRLGREVLFGMRSKRMVGNRK